MRQDKVSAQVSTIEFYIPFAVSLSCPFFHSGLRFARLLRAFELYNARHHGLLAILVAAYYSSRQAWRHHVPWQLQLYSATFLQRHTATHPISNIPPEVVTEILSSCTSSSILASTSLQATKPHQTQQDAWSRHSFQERPRYWSLRHRWEYHSQPRRPQQNGYC